jgi:hypothetical protein
MPSFSVTAALTTLLLVEGKVTLIECLVCEKSREGLSDDKVPTHDEAIASCNRMNDLLSFELVLESCQLFIFAFGSLISHLLSFLGYGQNKANSLIECSRGKD